MIDPRKYWKRMALRGKVLSIILLLLVLSFLTAIGYGIYNIPMLVENRAVRSVDALFTENDQNLAQGVAQNTGLLSDATKKVNRIKSNGLRDYLGKRIETAQQMADCINGTASLYNTKEDGTRTVIKNIQAFQIENLDKTLAILDQKGKETFTAKIREDMAEARTQYEQVSAVNAAIDALFSDGNARTVLNEDVQNEDCEAIVGLIDQIANPDLRNELLFNLADIQKSVAKQVEDQEAARAAAEEEARRQEEEAKQQEKENKKSKKDTFWDSLTQFFQP